MSFKIFPRFNLVDDGATVTGLGSSFESTSLPVSNVQNADLSRVARLSVPGAFAGASFVEVDHSATNGPDPQGFALAALQFTTADASNSAPMVRVRQNTTSSSDFTYVADPTAIASETRATHTLADLQEDPDDFTGTWPTFTGSAGQSSILRVDVPAPTRCRAVSRPASRARRATAPAATRCASASVWTPPART